MYGYQRTRWGIGGGGITEGVKTLLIVNGVAYLFQAVVGPRIILVLGLVPGLAWGRLFLWQFGTYMFLHGGLFHLVVNMYALWVFGCEVERMWGARAFYRYYFITGIGAGIIHSLIALAAGSSMVPTIGASGAVLGVLTAFAVLFPNRQITLLLFFLLPVTMQARTLALLFAGMSLFSGMAASGNVAHFAHLGGMLVGYLYMKRDWRFPAIWDAFYEWRRKRRMRVESRDAEDKEKLRRLVDRVLDKANDVGMENLTRDEKLLLKRASKILNREE